MLSQRMRAGVERMKGSRERV
ncbi:protein of unknown function [Candidatus Nitrospira inopinata]|uniref:Uncharacterized protein n=1 Tax=Candidatus Nitrospira inopinata TaxID=1715989 RepID=A0A0S4KQL0_9BACT|nr:protein of unknown function [Candidatus Nitrospira inopinata]